MERPKVLIPTIRSDQPGVIKTLAETDCAAALEQVGLEPVFISLYTHPKVLLDLHSLASGLLIPGGGDINPSMYGQLPHTMESPFDSSLDTLQAEEIEEASKNGKPVFGVCRGLQVMAIVSGGDLYQHLPDVLPYEAHGVSVEERDSLNKKAYHDVIIVPGTRAHNIFETERLTDVPSLHHQSLRNPGSLLRVSGRSPSGVIEIAEHIDPEAPFYLGVQFHPELDKRGAKEEGSLRVIFHHFATAVNERAGKNIAAHAA